MSTSRHCDTQHVSSPLQVVLLALLAIFATSCSYERDQPAKATEETPADLKPIAAAPEAAAENAASSADTVYSEAPRCNALVKRIAEEMLPCLQRIKPEMAEHLQTTIDTFRNGPRLRLDLSERDALLKKVDKECEEYWRQIQHQFDSKAPEGECLLKSDE